MYLFLMDFLTWLATAADELFDGGMIPPVAKERSPGDDSGQP